MRVAVFGAGAIGSFLGARLAQGGHEVLLIGRAEHVAAIERDGLVVEGLTAGVFRVGARTTILPDDRPDAVFLTVKSEGLEAAAAAIAGTLRAPVAIVAWQNGLGIEARLRSALARAGWPTADLPVVRAINSYGVTLVAPGRIRHAGDGEILLPERGDRVPAPTLDRIASALADGGLQVRRVEPFERELWRKALVNAAVNPVTADQGILNGALLEEPYRGQAERLLREAEAAARSEGFDFSDEEADRELWRVVRATARNRSSMLQDLDRGRPTEIEAISGEILAAGGRHGLDLPHTRRAIERIHRRVAQGSERPRRPDSP